MKDMIFRIVENALIPMFIALLTIYATRKDENNKNIDILKIRTYIMYEEIISLLTYMEESIIDQKVKSYYSFSNIDYKSIIYDFINLKTINIFRSYKLNNIDVNEPISLINFFKIVETLNNQDLTNNKYVDESIWDMYSDNTKRLIILEDKYKEIEDIFKNVYIERFLNRLQEFSGHKYKIEFKKINVLYDEGIKLLRQQHDNTIENIEKLKHKNKYFYSSTKNDIDNLMSGYESKKEFKSYENTEEYIKFSKEMFEKELYSNMELYNECIIMYVKKLINTKEDIDVLEYKINKKR